MASADINADDMAAVAEALSSGQLSIGPFLERFEQAFAAYVGTRHAIAVSSGTAGLHLCVRAAGIGPDDEVITTPFSFIASANCILFERATPVFVDIDETSMNIDPGLVADAVTPRTRAVLPVHVFGQPCAMDELTTLCDDSALVLIEDACEALGSEYRGRRAGGLGKAGVFGFYPNKQMTTGEGGIITTDDDEWAATFRSLRNQGRTRMGTWLHHEEMGFNYRLNEMSAALGYSQISRIDTLLEQRSKVAALYLEHLRQVPGIRLLSPPSTTTRMSWFVMIVRLEPGVSRNGVIDYLDSCGIPSRPYFTPIHLQPFFRDRFGYQPGDFPVTERVAGSTLALPFHNNMTADDIEYVASCLKAAVGKNLSRLAVSA